MTGFLVHAACVTTTRCRFALPSRTNLNDSRKRRSPSPLVGPRCRASALGLPVGQDPSLFGTRVGSHFCARTTSRVSCPPLNTENYQTAASRKMYGQRPVSTPARPAGSILGRGRGARGASASARQTSTRNTVRDSGVWQTDAARCGEALLVWTRFVTQMG